MISLYYAAITGLMKLLLLLLARWEVTGKEHVPKKGPLLIVANHLSLVDPPLLAASVPRAIHFMAKRELFTSFWSRLPVQAYGAFPVQRRGISKEGLARAQKLLAGGHALGAFPEGRRSRSARLQDADAGAALLALRAGVMVLPVGIAGTERLRTLRGWLSRPRLQVNIGAPFSLGPQAKKPKAAELSQATQGLMASIAQLLPPSYRGPYAAATPPAPAESAARTEAVALGDNP